MPKKKRGVRALRKMQEAREKDVPDNTVFWTTVAVIGIFIVVLSVVLLARHQVTGKIMYQWTNPEKPYLADPIACRNVPMCGAEQSFMCCAKDPVPGFGDQRCTAPIYKLKSEAPICPGQMPYACPCPEKFQYRQSRPIPFE